MNDLKYIIILSEDDYDIPRLTQIHKLPDISRFLSIGDNYFHYVTNTKNVYFYKIHKDNTLIGSVHLEKNGGVLYMDILIFPEFQHKGFGTKIIEDIKNDVFVYHSTNNGTCTKCGEYFVSKDNQLAMEYSRHTQALQTLKSSFVLLLLEPPITII